MMRRSLFFVLLCIAAPAWAEETHMLSRDLACTDYPSGRSQEICTCIAKELEWEWTGHAIIAPGWKVSFHTLRTTYCMENISPRDIPALKNLAQATDMRLQQAASGLLTLLKTLPGAALPGDAYDPHNGEVYSTDENSVFNPRNPRYILLGGCKE